MRESGDPLIVRVRMPLDEHPSQRNLMDKLLGYRNIVDVPNSISVVPDAVAATINLIEMGFGGIFNMVNPGTMTHRELIEMYEKISDTEIKKSYIDEKQLRRITKAPRSNCILSTHKLERAGIKLRPIKEAAEDVLRQHWARRQAA